MFEDDGHVDMYVDYTKCFTKILFTNFTMVPLIPSYTLSISHTLYPLSTILFFIAYR